MPELVVHDVHKRLGGNAVLEGVSLTVERGEIVALLGHSGSGKTTILRSVAGLETPDAGRVVLGERTVFDAATGVEVPPEKRHLGLVFQSYALWPNRRVIDTVAYGLRLRRTGEAEVRRRVGDVLERLGLTALAERYPDQLSGGQQQRVALARALVYQPPVLLLDEPLSNLDAKLREEARAWLRQLIKQVQISALYVTHDQVEAMAIADRILFLRDGRIEQQGTPREMYEQPATVVTAEFMGSNNRIAGKLGAVDGARGRLDVEDVSLWGTLRAPLPVGGGVTGLIRVERTGLAAGAGDNHIAMDLEASLYLGERWEHLLARGPLRVRVWSHEPLMAGPPRAHWVEFPAGALWLF